MTTKKCVSSLIYLLRIRFRFSFCLSRDFIGFSRCFPLTPTFSECTGSQDKTAANKSDLKWLRHGTCTYAFCTCLLETSLLILGQRYEPSSTGHG